MNQDKVLREIKTLRKEVKSLKKGMKSGTRQGTMVSVTSLFIGLGLAVFMFFTNQVYEIMDVEFVSWNAWLGVIVGLLIMMIPGFIINAINKR